MMRTDRFEARSRAVRSHRCRRAAPEFPGARDDPPQASPLAVAALLTCGLAAVSGESLAFNSAAEIEPGTRIQVLAPALGRAPVQGTFLSMRGDTLTFRQGRQVDNPYSIVSTSESRTVDVVLEPGSRLERSVGVGHTGAAAGAIIGGLGGLAIGGLIGAEADAVVSAFSLGTAQADETRPMLIGVAIGAVTGGLIGSGFDRDVWVPVDLHAQTSWNAGIRISGESVALTVHW